MDPTWNPACFVNHCFDSNEALPNKTASAFLQSSRAVDIHYGAWLERRRWTTIANDPDRLPEYILASYLSETVDIVQLARDIPLIGRIVPDKKWILLPARVIAMARLCIDCHKQHDLINQAINEHQQELLKLNKNDPNFFNRFKHRATECGQCAHGMVDEVIHGPNEPIKVVQCVFGPIILVMGVASIPLGAAQDCLSPIFDKADCKAKHLKWITSAYYELAMRYVHLYKTARGDEYAIKDALLRMPEHLEVLDSEGAPVLKKLTEYCQQHWIGVPGLELLSTDRCKNALSAWKDGAKRLAPIANSEAVTAIPRKQLEATSNPILDEVEGSSTTSASEVKERNAEPLQEEMSVPQARSWLLKHSALLSTVGATILATVVTRWGVVQMWRIAASLRR